MDLKTLRVVPVLCVLAVIYAAPLDYERKTDQINGKTGLAAKIPDAKYEVMGLKSNEQLLPAAIEQKRNPELKELINRGYGRRNRNRNRNRKGISKSRMRGWNRYLGNRRRKNKHEAQQKQEGKEKSRAGGSDEGYVSPTYATHQVPITVFPVDLKTQPSSVGEEAPGVMAFENLAPELITSGLAGQAKASESGLVEDQVVAAPAAQSLVLPESATGASSASIAPTTLSDLPERATSPPSTKTRSLSPTSKSGHEHTTTKKRETAAVGVVNHYFVFNPPPPL